jgi:hypothetical protein
MALTSLASALAAGEWCLGGLGKIALFRVPFCSLWKLRLLLDADFSPCYKVPSMAGTTFDSKSKTVGELLGTNSRERIVVPTFQRGYEWSKKHVESFWKDILQFQKDSSMADGPEKYFLGPIVVLKRSKEIIELLDGQQRLATATILFSVLRDIARTARIADGDNFARDTQTQLLLKENGDCALELGETDAEYFRDAIQLESQTPPKTRIRTHRNIKTARDLLMEKVKNQISVSNPNATLAVLRGLKQTLRSDLVMACITVESERDAFRIFETLNDRGLRLSVPDLLLNYLMREAKPEGHRQKIRQFWTEMIERMGRRDINRFLRHMWVSKYGDLKSKDLFTAIKDHIEERNLSSLDFARSCADECELYVQLITFDEIQLGKDGAKYARRLLQDLDSQASLPLLLSALQNFPLDEFAKLCQWLLVFVTRYSVIANLDSSGLETVFFDLARQIRSMMAEEAGKAKSSVANCATHVKNTLIKNAPSDPQIRSAIVKLILASDEAGYVMGRLADYMQTSTKEVTINETNVEHVFPKSPEENEWGGKANHEVLEPYLWHIGNLTILGTRINRSAANREFSIKKEHYARKSELEITQRIAEHYDVWNVDSITDRAEKLAPDVLAIWSFSNPSRV